MNFRSEKLLGFAKDQLCMFCLQPKATVVPVHVNSVALGKGTGEKAGDQLAAWGCQDCHDLYDGRRPGWSPADRFERFAWAYLRTMKALFEQGLVVVKRGR